MCFQLLVVKLHKAKQPLQALDVHGWCGGLCSEQPPLQEGDLLCFIQPCGM